MELRLDRSKQYGLVLEGGGAKGAYQVGAWKAIREAGIEIRGIAGASVGALNGAFVCMDDVKLAESVWENIRYSDILDVDDDAIEALMKMDFKSIEVRHVLENMKRVFRDRGFDITPLRNLMASVIDEEKIRNSEKDLYVVTYSFQDRKLLTVDVKETAEGEMGDMLLASAYFPAFKNEKLGGRRYLDGGSLNNVPINVLLERDYKDIIVIRIYGVGFDSEKVTKIPDDVNVYRVAPRQDLGGVLEFDSKKARRNMLLGYYDAKRMLYGLAGKWYYVDVTETEEQCLKRLLDASRVWISQIMEQEDEEADQPEDWDQGLRWYLEQLFPRLAERFELRSDWTYRDLYVALLESLARKWKVSRFAIYTADELKRQIEQQIYKEEKRQMNLKGRHFLTLMDYTPEEILYLLDLAAELKDKKKKGIPVDMHRGKNVALIFEKTSTRTRCSFEVAAHDLGMGTTYLDPKSSQIGKKESIADTARVLGRMYEGIEYRGFGQEIVAELAKHAGVPVWNGLTNEFHPTQMLADLLTIREHFGRLQGIKLVYMGDARYNMGNSLMIACSKMGLDFTACAPKKYFPSQELVAACQEYAKASGSTITLTEDVTEGTRGADVIYTDVWVSMGEPDEVWEERIRELSPYKVTKQVMENAGPQSIFLHCLPAFHDLKTTIGKEMAERFSITDMEVTDEVFESSKSKVFDEAENRMHTIKAVMAATLGV